MHMDSLNFKNFDISLRIRKKLVVVGDGNTGKTAMLMVQANQPFPEDYIPTIFESYLCRIPIKKQLVELNLWDTAGQEEYDRLRPLSYPDTDVVILCYNVSDFDSFYNVTERWYYSVDLTGRYPETRHFLSKVPVILVACKTDLRPADYVEPEDPTARCDFITYEQGVDLAKRIGAINFFGMPFLHVYHLECSAKESVGINEIFQKAAAVSLKKDKKRVGQGECIML